MLVAKRGIAVKYNVLSTDVIQNRFYGTVLCNFVYVDFAFQICETVRHSATDVAREAQRSRSSDKGSFKEQESHPPFQLQKLQLSAQHFFKIVA